MDRALAHIEEIAWVKEIPGADNIEKIGVLGWVLIAKKGEFIEGDPCCFFEIDSKLPEREWSAFLANKHYKVKTMKLNKFEPGGIFSQGLALPLTQIPELDGKVFKIGEDVTELLGVKYSLEEDNKRKAKVNPNAKYNAMAARHPKLAKKKWFRWLMKREWGKKMLFVLLGKKKDVTDTSFPNKFEFVHKTDETRCENMPQEFLQNKEPWCQTLKVDGTSGTYVLERTKKGFEYYVCSRNVRQLTPDQATYHKDNVYWEAEFKYHIRDFLEDVLVYNPELSYVALQGEIAGEGIQGNPHKLKGINFFGFNFIDSKNGRWGTVQAANFCWTCAEIPWVPIINESYTLPDTMEELKLQADGECDIPGSSGMREGFVYRSIANPNKSFKNVSRQYLLKHCA